MRASIAQFPAGVNRIAEKPKPFTAETQRTQRNYKKTALKLRGFMQQNSNELSFGNAVACSTLANLLFWPFGRHTGAGRYPEALILKFFHRGDVRKRKKPINPDIAEVELHACECALLSTLELMIFSAFSASQR